MQVNLRKANAIQAEIKKAINGVKTEVNVSVSEFTADISKAVANAATEFLNAVKRKEQLNTALFEIRAAVGRANAQAGVGDLLAEVERIDGKMGIIAAVANAQVAKSVDELNARVEKLKSNSTGENSRLALYGDRYSTVETSVVTQSVIDQYKAEVKALKRAKQDLQDKLLNVNVGTTITLSADTVTVLKEEGIL
jgi:polyhydroxyalkanoate synthesis regulator phasin